MKIGWTVDFQEIRIEKTGEKLETGDLTSFF
jgi:hypothetical protein